MEIVGSGVYAREVPAIDRWIRVGIASGSVIKVDFPSTDPVADADSAPVLDALVEYLESGTPIDGADIPIGLTGPTSYRPIYDTIRAIPFGTRITVQTVCERTAEVAGRDDGPELVRAAIDANPVPVLVPTHRITDHPPAMPSPVFDRCRSVEGL